MMIRDETKRRPQQVVVRLPHDIKAWLEHEAARNGASQGSEIARTLRARMDAEQSKKASS